jgi:hypothetical protein
MLNEFNERLYLCDGEHIYSQHNRAQTIHPDKHGVVSEDHRIKYNVAHQ